MDKFKKTFSLRKKKSPDDLNLLKPQQWQEDERKVREGTCSFQVKYLGHLEVFESRGMQVCEEALKVLRKTKVAKGQRAILYVSGDALRVTDEISKGLIVDQTIDKVSFCAPDRNHERGFAYICRDGTTRRWICHGFLAVKESGERLSHAVGCAFAICLEKKQKREKESVHISYNDDKTSFTRQGSFRPASLMERIQDPQSAIIADPLPTNSSEQSSMNRSQRARSSARDPMTTSTLSKITELPNENSKKPTTSSTTTASTTSSSAAVGTTTTTTTSTAPNSGNLSSSIHNNSTTIGNSKGKDCNEDGDNIKKNNSLSSIGLEGEHNVGNSSNVNSSVHAIPRPHASTTVFDRQRSLRMFPKLNETTSPFKREFSLRLEELPSSLRRSQQTYAETIQEDDGNEYKNDLTSSTYAGGVGLNQFLSTNKSQDELSSSPFSPWGSTSSPPSSSSLQQQPQPPPRPGTADPFSSAPVNSNALQHALFSSSIHSGGDRSAAGFTNNNDSHEISSYSTATAWTTGQHSMTPVPPPPSQPPPHPSSSSLASIPTTYAHHPTNPFPMPVSSLFGGSNSGFTSSTTTTATTMTNDFLSINERSTINNNGGSMSSSTSGNLFQSGIYFPSSLLSTNENKNQPTLSPKNPWNNNDSFTTTSSSMFSKSTNTVVGPKDPFDVGWIEKEKFFLGFGNNNNSNNNNNHGNSLLLANNSLDFQRSSSAAISTNPFLNNL